MPEPLDRSRRLVGDLAGSSLENLERLVRVAVKESDVAADRVEELLARLLTASERTGLALAEAARTEAELLARRLDLGRRLDPEQIEERLVHWIRTTLAEPDDGSATRAARPSPPRTATREDHR